MTIQTMLTTLCEGFELTLLLFFLTLVISLPLGFLVAFGRMAKNVIVRSIFRVYISIMRGTPLMLQMLVVYFGPNLIFGIALPRNWRILAVVIAFGLNYAAYFAEIYRGGIEAMPVGQYEAAEVLGYGKTQTFLKIILPQVVKNILPSVTNEVITLVKDTSLAYAVGMTEMFTSAKQIAVAPNSPGMLALVVAGVFYFVFNFLVDIVMAAFEKKLAYYR